MDGWMMQTRLFLWPLSRYTLFGRFTEMPYIPDLAVYAESFLSCLLEWHETHWNDVDLATLTLLPCDPVNF